MNNSEIARRTVVIVTVSCMLFACLIGYVAGVTATVPQVMSSGSFTETAQMQLNSIRRIDRTSTAAAARTLLYEATAEVTPTPG